jgi:hypothetical protein
LLAVFGHLHVKRNMAENGQRVWSRRRIVNGKNCHSSLAHRLPLKDDALFSIGRSSDPDGVPMSLMALVAS